MDPLQCAADTAGALDSGIAGFLLPELPYALDALAPVIIAETMALHHGKHHSGYVKNLNAALEGQGYTNGDLVNVLKQVKEDVAVRNNGGGHYNHAMFWVTMTPPSKDGAERVVPEPLGDAIRKSFEGGLEQMKSEFGAAAKKRFGSGWAWLGVDPKSKGLKVTSTPNQDNPLMTNIIPQHEQMIPILGLDVWEHAYYLQYKNDRASYIENWWGVVNWDKVNKIYQDAIEDKPYVLN